ncbi:hypothetical protein FHG87_019058 [Trinorchestia longiramus]|nr:hypothetical protein FHG87_019058 [Trinorchestia longiramus]
MSSHIYLLRVCAVGRREPQLHHMGKAISGAVRPLDKCRGVSAASRGITTESWTACMLYRKGSGLKSPSQKPVSLLSALV